MPSTSCVGDVPCAGEAEGGGWAAQEGAQGSHGMATRWADLNWESTFCWGPAQPG